MSQIRSFLAIDLDDDFKPKVNKIIKEFKKIDANIKFVDSLFAEYSFQTEATTTDDN